MIKTTDADLINTLYDIKKDMDKTNDGDEVRRAEFENLMLSDCYGCRKGIKGSVEQNSKSNKDAHEGADELFLKDLFNRPQPLSIVAIMGRAHAEGLTYGQFCRKHGLRFSGREIPGFYHKSPDEIKAERKMKIPEEREI